MLKKIALKDDHRSGFAFMVWLEMKFSYSFYKTKKSQVNFEKQTAEFDGNNSRTSNISTAMSVCALTRQCYFILCWHKTKVIQDVCLRFAEQGVLSEFVPAISRIWIYPKNLQITLHRCAELECSWLEFDSMLLTMVMILVQRLSRGNRWTSVKTKLFHSCIAIGTSRDVVGYVPRSMVWFVPWPKCIVSCANTVSLKHYHLKHINLCLNQFGIILALCGV